MLEHEQRRPDPDGLEDGHGRLLAAPGHFL